MERHSTSSLAPAPISRQGAPTPSALPDLVQTARRLGTLTLLLTAVTQAGLEPTLVRIGPLTLFAPSDAAFLRLPRGSIEALLAEPAKLVQVLTYHLVPGRITTAEVMGLRSAPTLNGEDLPVYIDGGLVVHGARVAQGDIGASNGVIHIIDQVLLPAMI